jgi:hypothetical protein
MTNIQALFDSEKEKSHKSSYSHPNSPETRAKMSRSLKGREVWNKGIPATEERKANIALSKIGKELPKKWKPIMTPNGVFPSAKAVAAAAGVTYVTVWNWMKRWPNDYYYIDKEV